MLQLSFHKSCGPDFWTHSVWQLAEKESEFSTARLGPSNPKAGTVGEKPEGTGTGIWDFKQSYRTKLDYQHTVVLSPGFYNSQNMEPQPNSFNAKADTIKENPQSSNGIWDFKQSWYLGGIASYLTNDSVLDPR